MAYDRARLSHPPVPAAVPHAFPSPSSDSEQMNPIYHQHSPHPPGAPHLPPQSELLDHVEQELRARVSYATHTNPHGANHRKIVFTETKKLHEELSKFIVDWRNRYLYQIGESTKRHPDDSDDDVLEDPRAPKKHQGPAAGSDDEEDGEKGTGQWQCLFYEHNPAENIQCRDRRFKRVSELRRHIKTHTLPFDCSICGYRTAEERRLTGHKCEQANRKKYNPITPAERIQHQKLQKLGVKVGHMKQILFGDAALGHSRDNSSGSERQSNGNSSTESLAAPEAPVSMPATSVPVYHPAPYLPQQQNFMFTTAPPTAPVITMAPPFTPSPQPYLPSTYSPPPSTLPQNIPQTMPQPMMPYVTLAPQPAYTGYPITHSPQTGHAGLYYRDGEDSPTSINSYSPGYTAYTTEPSAPPAREHSATSVNTYLQQVFPEVFTGGNNHEPVLNRAMPQSEIEAMERNLALQARGISPLSRRATTFILQQNVHIERNQLLVRLRKGNQSLSDKARKFLRSMSMRKRKDNPTVSRTSTLQVQPEEPATAPVVTSVLPTPPASDAGEATESPAGAAERPTETTEVPNEQTQRPAPTPQQPGPERKRSFLKKLLVSTKSISGSSSSLEDNTDRPAVQERRSWKRMVLGNSKPATVSVAA